MVVHSVVPQILIEKLLHARHCVRAIRWCVRHKTFLTGSYRLARMTGKNPKQLSVQMQTHRENIKTSLDQEVGKHSKPLCQHREWYKNDKSHGTAQLAILGGVHPGGTRAAQDSWEWDCGGKGTRPMDPRKEGLQTTLPNHALQRISLILKRKKRNEFEVLDMWCLFLFSLCDCWVFASQKTFRNFLG